MPFWDYIGKSGRHLKENRGRNAVFSQADRKRSRCCNGRLHFDDMIDLTVAGTVTRLERKEIDSRLALQWNMENSSFLRLSLIGKNLTDKEYLQEALPLAVPGLTDFAGGFQGWGPPRTIALELLYQH